MTPSGASVILRPACKARTNRVGDEDATVPKVLVMIEYEVEPAKREAYLVHARQMRDHAVDVLGLDFHVHEDEDHPGRFTELFTCASQEAYEELDEKQDDAFRSFVAGLERFTDLSQVRYSARVQAV